MPKTLTVKVDTKTYVLVSRCPAGIFHITIMTAIFSTPFLITVCQYKKSITPHTIDVYNQYYDDYNILASGDKKILSKIQTAGVMS